MAYAFGMLKSHAASFAAATTVNLKLNGSDFGVGRSGFFGFQF
jgi:hypothetical protein